MPRSLPDPLFERVLLPVAAEADARVVRDVVLPYLADVGGDAVVVHVIKRIEGTVDPSPPSMQAEDAVALFEIVREGEDDPLEETRTATGDDIAATIFAVADEVDASVVVVAPRAKSRLVRLLTGDTALSLVTDPPVPVLAIPSPEEA